MLAKVRIERVQCNTIIKDLDKAIYKFCEQYGRWPSHIRMQYEAWDWLIARLRYDRCDWEMEFSATADTLLRYKGVRVYIGNTGADEWICLEL